jgi:uncharacterized protein YutE (UPF0331/DUF86 family)
MSDNLQSVNCAAPRLYTQARANYGEAFRKLADARVIEPALAERLIRAAGFRNVVAHAYETLDMNRVFAAAVQGPADLQAFLGALARLAEPI